MVLEGGELQGVGHRVQLVVGQLRKQVLGQDQGVKIEGVEAPARAAAVFPEEPGVKGGVVGAQGRVPRPVQEGVHRLLRPGRAPQQLVGDPGEGDGFRAEGVPRLGEGGELVHHRPVPYAHRADLDDGVRPGVQPRGLQVEGHKLPVQGCVAGAVDGGLLVHVILVIRLHAVEDLDLFPPARGVVGVGEGLQYPVVGDGDGGVAPLDGPLHHRLGVAQAVHHGHFGM